MRDYTRLLTAGNLAQLEKLQRNEHKKGFDDIKISYAIRRLRHEMLELEDAVFIGDPREIRQEAADVANFAHMLILTCDNLLAEEELAIKESPEQVQGIAKIV